MRSIFRIAMTLTAVTVGITCTGSAQTTTPNSAPANLTAKMEPPATPAATPNAPATSTTASDPAGSTAAADTTHPAAGKEKSELKPSLTDQVEALIMHNQQLENRIELLETEIQQNRAQALRDTENSALLKQGEKELLEGTGTGAHGDGTYTQATPPPAAAAAATPELGAQTTTAGEPFPGDWTWSNNGGHNSDSPMATKYFTPEFRSDANYTIDMNHPEDDTLGGSTETFRSDEWQLEQISIGGDIRIDNVRGRFLCLCGGLWAVTTTRNDPSVVRGSWDLSAAYKYVAEGWGGYHWNVQHLSLIHI